MRAKVRKDNWKMKGTKPAHEDFNLRQGVRGKDARREN